MQNRLWRDLDLVAFDTETTGQFPLSAEVCELAAVKWRAGREIDRFTTLLKPSRPMDQEVIAIHGITNAMVEDAPKMSEKINDFHQFIQGAVVVAHHAPFDLGFMALEFEDAGLSLPTEPALCSSLLSRQLFPESPNHRLQTLISFFKLHQGQAHRAEDDARACLEVTLLCLKKLGEEAPLSLASEAQGGSITWERFSMRALESNANLKTLIQAVRDNQVCDVVYNKGSKPGKARRLHPRGIVRSLNGDFLVAYDELEQKAKRYFLSEIASVNRL